MHPLCLQFAHSRLSAELRRNPRRTDPVRLRKGAGILQIGNLPRAWAASRPAQPTETLGDLPIRLTHSATGRPTGRLYAASWGPACALAVGGTLLRSSVHAKTTHRTPPGVGAEKRAISRGAVRIRPVSVITVSARHNAKGAAGISAKAIAVGEGRKSPAIRAVGKPWS